MKTNTHGGKREGAGRPAKEPTKTLSYRVPEHLAPAIDESIRKIITKIIKLKKPSVKTEGRSLTN